MTDLEALAAYHRDRNAEAFRQLVHTYQSLVYASCRRLLDNPADVADATQETFVRLAKHAGRINRNVAAWLHATARTVANDRRRSDRSRQQREAAWSELNNTGETPNLLPVVDDCLARLPEEHRELLLQHYLQGRTQTDLAQEKGVSQPAISKRLGQAMDSLRQRLKESGVAVSAAVVAGALTESASDAAVPATLTASLGEIGMTAPAILVGGKLGITAAVLVILAATVAFLLRERPPEPAAEPPPPAPVVAQPEPVQESETIPMPPAETHTDERFAHVTARVEGARVYLTPIPLFPYRIRWNDGQGNAVRYEDSDGVPYCRILQNLYCAMRMQGHDIRWPELACISGDAFRFTFESRWAQDVEFVSHIDHFALACRNLGFDYTWSTERSREESMALIEQALRAGRPALVCGWGTRHWRVVVGLEPDRGTYLGIGGLVWDDGSEPLRLDLPLGAPIPEHLAPEACPHAPLPVGDWYGAVLGPEQVARNPVFLLGERREVPAPLDRIRRTLRIAREMNQPLEIARTKLAYRAKAREWDMGHDGWKFYYSPWDGTFVTGSAGLRAWADLVEGMEKPTTNFEMLHGIDTAMGNQIRRAAGIVDWLEWAEPQVPPAVAEKLALARLDFAELADVCNDDLGLCCPGYVDDGAEARTLEEVTAILDHQPALCYILSKQQRDVLGDRGRGAQNSPWGWRLLPSPEVFEEAKVLVGTRLRHLADLRDHAFQQLAEAEQALSQ